MSAERTPPRHGDVVVIYGPPVVVEEVTGDVALVTSDGLTASVPAAWLVVVHDRPAGGR